MAEGLRPVPPEVEGTKVNLGHVQSQLPEMTVPYDVQVNTDGEFGDVIAIATLNKTAGERSATSFGKNPAEVTAKALRSVLGAERPEVHDVHVSGPVFAYTEDGTRSVTVEATDATSSWYSTASTPDRSVPPYRLVADAVTDAFRFRSAHEEQQR